MPTIHSSPPKPVSQFYRPEITRLPRLTIRRRAFRRVVNFLLRILVRLAARCEVNGLHNLPAHGAALLVSNHLGDADMVLGMAFTPRPVEIIAKAELYDLPVLGKLMDLYGVIWVHRGRPDRNAIRVALEALAQGRLVAIAPEGRESLIGGLEEGTHGAAYLALKSGAPLIPVTFTGSENARVFTNLKRFKRTEMSLKIGEPFYLSPQTDRKRALEEGTREIMERLAFQLPKAYRGVYQVEREGQEIEEAARERES